MNDGAKDRDARVASLRASLRQPSLASQQRIMFEKQLKDLLEINRGDGELDSERYFTEDKIRALLDRHGSILTPAERNFFDERLRQLRGEETHLPNILAERVEKDRLPVSLKYSSVDLGDELGFGVVKDGTLITKQLPTREVAELEVASRYYFDYAENHLCRGIRDILEELRIRYNMTEPSPTRANVLKHIIETFKALDINVLLDKAGWGPMKVAENLQEDVRDERDDNRGT